MAPSGSEAAAMDAVGVAFAALPPPAGFAFYFLGVHGPWQMSDLAQRHAPHDARRGWLWAVRSGVPLGAGTISLGAVVL